MVEFDPETIANLEEGLKRLEELAKSGLSLDVLKKNLTDLGSKFGMSASEISEWTGRLKGAAEAAKNFISTAEALQGASEFFERLKKNGVLALDEIKSKMGDTGLSNEAMVAKLSLINPWMLRLQDVPAHFTAIGESAQNSQAQISKMLNNNKVFSEMQNALSGVFGKLLSKEDIQKYAQMADASRNLQRDMMMTAAASGNLSEFLKKNGSDLSGLTSSAVAYNEKITSIAASTGRLPEEVAKFQKELALIPGALNNMNTQTDISGEKMNMLEAALRFADGSGQEAKSVFEDLSFAASNLGLQGEDALQFLDRMQRAADAVNLPLKDVRDAVKAAAQEFAMLGDNTDAAINLMSRLAPALQRVGVAPEQAKRIFADITDGISNMSVAQKAFLSQSTGGAGGLQGAFQIEQMLAEGKMDQVFSKMQQNMRRQFGGGPIVTRDQAAQSPEMAAQYQRQVMLMMSPAMGNMAKDSNSAAKLIEAMSKGDLTQFAEGMAGDTEMAKDEALSETMKHGVTMQDKTNTILTEINAKMARIAGNSAAAVNDVRAQVESDMRTALNYRSRKEVRQDSGRLARSNALTGNDLTSSVDVNKMYEESSDPAKEILTKEDASLKDFGIAALDILKNLVGFSQYQQLPGYDENPDGSPRTRPTNSGVLIPPQIQSPENRTMQAIERAEAQRPERTPTAAKKEKNEVKVDVHTVCVECHKTIARDAANQAIKHNHASNLNQAHTGAGL